MAKQLLCVCFLLVLPYTLHLRSPTNVTIFDHTGPGNSYRKSDTRFIAHNSTQSYKILLSKEVRYLRIRSHSSNATSAAQLHFVLRSVSQQHAWTLPYIDDVAIKGLNKYSKQVCANDELFLMDVSTFSKDPIEFTIEMHSFSADQMIFDTPNTFAVKPRESYYSHITFLPSTNAQANRLKLKLFSNSTTIARVSLVRHTCSEAQHNLDTKVPHIIQTMTTRSVISVHRNHLPEFDLIIEILSKYPESKWSESVSESAVQVKQANHRTTRRRRFISVPDTNKDITLVLSLQSKSDEFYFMPTIYFLLLSFGGSFGVLILCVTPGSQKWLRWPRPDYDQVSEKKEKQLEHTIISRMKSAPVKNTTFARGSSEQGKVAKLARLISGSSDPLVSGSFFYNLIVISAFYCLPALQMIFSYYETAYADGGNQDNCYYNFECAHPWGPFAAANNLISNATYVTCGIIFMIIVRFHSGKLTWRFLEVFYAMGLALALEGLLSAGYHVCPTPLNFQFDTTFMYLISGLCTYHLFQMRHPGHENHPYKFYGIFATAVGFVVICLSTGHDSFWRLPLIVSYFSAAIYVGFYVNAALFKYRRGCRETSIWLVTGFRVLQGLLTIGFVISSTWALVSAPSQFPSALLFMFILNLLLYTLFCVVIKLANGELLVAAPIACGVAAAGLWVFALYFYTVRVTQWDLNPAESRALNRPCVFLDYFDDHDVWHMGSAYGLFACFLLLLTLDDGQSNHVAGDIVDVVEDIMNVFEHDSNRKMEHLEDSGSGRNISTKFSNTKED